MNYIARLQRDPLTSVAADGSTVDLLAQDRDVKDFLETTPQTFDGDVDLSSNTTETNQLSLNACAGNATGDSIEVLNDIEEKATAIKEGRAPHPTAQVSRLFIYNMTRESLGDLQKDEGTFIRACFDTLGTFGVCDETVWPYDPSKVFTSPSMKAQRTAVGNRIHSCYKMKEDSNRADNVVAALRAQHPVVFGTGITKSFMALADDTPQAKPDSSDIVGNHAMMIVGYYSQLGFLVKNSWGKGWGANGFWFMTPEYLEADFSFDFWVPTRFQPLD